MLEIELDLRRINAAHAGYLAQGTIAGSRYACRVKGMRTTINHQTVRFSIRQSQAAALGGAILADGRLSTIIRNVTQVPPRTTWQIRAAAAVLNGIHVPALRIQPVVPCCPGGPDWLGCDNDAYLAQVDDGPGRNRIFSDITALALYMGLLNKIVFVWIGAESDLGVAVDALETETANWTDFAPVSQQYAAALNKACLHYVQSHP